MQTTELHIYIRSKLKVLFTFKTKVLLEIMEGITYKKLI